MESTAPSAGQYRAWLAGGMIRLGTSPVYRITADCTADSAGDSTAAQLISTLAGERGITDINATDVTALDADNDAVLGVLVAGDPTLDVLDMLARSVGAWYGFDRAGTLRMHRYGLPAASAGGLPVIAPWNTAALENVPNGEDVPTETVRVKYARYWQPTGAGEFAGAVTEADASAEAERLHGITAGVRRTFAATSVALADQLLAGLDIDQEVELRWARYGLGETLGTTMLVIEMTEDLIEQRADLLLWGRCV